VEVFARELLSRIAKDRLAITVLSAPHEERLAGVELVQIPVLRREASPVRNPYFGGPLARFGLGAAELESLSLMLRGRGILKGSRFDIVVPMGGLWSCRLAARYCGVSRLLGIGQAGVVPRELRLLDHFVALTDADEQKARELRPDLGITVIPNGVDTTRFCPAPLGSLGTEKTLLCVGALTTDKRHDLLLDAVLRLPASVRLLIVGEGPERARLMRHSLCRQGRVEFLRCPHEEMPAVYRRADAFTLASPGEAFGIAFLEAMASALPVVAHDAPRQRCVLGAAARYCNVYEAASYAQSLDAALKDGRNATGLRRAQEFDWDVIAERYAALLAA
jgi:glycosyltransferase involved in cell wall biosynthesis